MTGKNAKPGTGGDRYVPYGDRIGDESAVYFTRDLSADGLLKIYSRVGSCLSGKIGIKLHTGEKNGPNIIPGAWVERLVRTELPTASIIETNTYYEGDRYDTATHLETARSNGWTFCPVDILDAGGAAMIPVDGGKWFKEISVGKGLTAYDSMLALTHFKGHAAGGFGGSNKNIGIGCADGRVGKKMIHTTPGSNDMWDIEKEEFNERMTESTKASLRLFGDRVAYINVMRNMSVSCDCEGCAALPVVTPNIGIAASLDILAVDQASVDMVYALDAGDRKALAERIETRHGLRQLSYMKELGMGNDRYALIDIDNGDARISAKDAVIGVKPFGS